MYRKRSSTCSKELGDKIRELRTSAGLSLRKFAKMIDLSPTYLSLVERSAVIVPRTEVIETIASTLGADADELLAISRKIPSDVSEAILQRPKALAELIRASKSLPDNALKHLVSMAKQSGNGNLPSNNTNEPSLTR